MILIARMKQILNGLLAYVQNEYDTIPEQETLLYQMFYGMKDGSFDFYKEAKEIFLRRNTNPRKLSVVMEFPKDKSHMPCIVLREPARSTVRPAPLGGFGLALEDVTGSPEYEREGFRQPTLSKLSLMCFSSNMLESILISEVIYALLQGARNTFEEEFISFSFNTNELLAENNLFPQPIMIKSIDIEVEEIDKYVSIIRPELISKFVIEDAIPVGSDPTWTPPEETQFEFGNAYVWLDEITNTGENHIYSNRDWELVLEEDMYKSEPAYKWMRKMIIGKVS